MRPHDRYHISRAKLVDPIDQSKRTAGHCIRRSTRCDRSQSIHQGIFEYEYIHRGKGSALESYVVGCGHLARIFWVVGGKAELCPTLGYTAALETMTVLFIVQVEGMKQVKSQIQVR